MIATFLILSATVRRAQVKRVVGLQVFLQAKGDADEAAGTLSRGGFWCARRATHLDRAVGKLHLLNQRKLTDKKWESVTNPRALFGSHAPLPLLGRHALQPVHPPSNLLGKRQLQALIALQRGRLRRHVVELEPVGRLKWEVLRLRLPRLPGSKSHALVMRASRMCLVMTPAEPSIANGLVT